MERVLITGGTGFVGSALAAGLRRMNYEVVAVSTMSDPNSARVKAMRDAGVELVRCDLFSEELRAVVSKARPEAVVHAVGLAGLIASSGRMPTAEEYKRANVDSTARILSASRESGVGQFVYLGSAAEYGKPAYLPIDEKHPTNPISPYGISKLAGEKLASEFRSESMRVFVPRIFNAYGPNPTRPDVVSQIIDSVRNNKAPVLNGEGKPTRDFIYVTDVVDAVEAGIRKGLSLVLNVATGRETSLLELAELVIKTMGSSLKPVLKPGRSGDVDRSVADVSKAAGLGIKAKISLEEGIRLLAAQ
jgi:UDP-glucose 4-epimerase